MRSTSRSLRTHVHTRAREFCFVMKHPLPGKKNSGDSRSVKKKKQLLFIGRFYIFFFTAICVFLYIFFSLRKKNMLTNKQTHRSVTMIKKKKGKKPRANRAKAFAKNSAQQLAAHTALEWNSFGSNSIFSCDVGELARKNQREKSWPDGIFNMAVFSLTRCLERFFHWDGVPDITPLYETMN